MKNLCVCTAFFVCFSLSTNVYSQIPTKSKEGTTGNAEQENILVEKPDNATYFLSLEKRGRKKRLRFYEGDRITITFKGSKERFTPTITKITAKQVEVFDTPLELEKVAKITLYSQSKLREQAANLLPAAGVLYFLGDMVNPIFSGREPFRVHRGSITVPAILIGSGLLLRLFAKRTLKMNKHRYLRILEKI